MKLTRERKICGAVLVLAIAGLGVNQLIPSAATAESPEQYAVNPGKPATASAAAPDILGPSAPAAAATFTIAEQLHAFQSKSTSSANSAGVKDAFAPSWRPRVEVVVQKKPEGPTEAEIIARFQQGHPLTGVMTATQGGFAMIKGSPVAVGKTVDGFKLVAVTQRSATFHSPEGTPVILTLTQSVPLTADASR